MTCHRGYVLTNHYLLFSGTTPMPSKVLQLTGTLL